jgi:IS30 family transposase
VSQADEIQRLRDEGLLLREIGERLGLSKSAVWRALHPEEVRALNRRRRAAKRENERTRRKACPQCGEPMGAGSAGPANRSKGCVRCRRERERAARLVKAREIERRWRAGETAPEIAEALSTTPKTIQVEIFRLRREGLADLPYRRKAAA